MYSSFEKLPEEKKALILQICIEEFAHNGYNYTSTDVITSKAGISKGILFHYFKSKKNLYVFLVKHCRELLSQKTLENIRENEKGDFFERIRNIIRVKQRVTKQFYNETRLIMDAFLNPPQAVKKEMEEMYKLQRETFENPAMLSKMYRKDLLASGDLRYGVSAERVIQLVFNLIDQLTNRILQNAKGNMSELFDHEHMIKELDEYFEIIKHGIYKKELS